MIWKRTTYTTLTITDMSIDYSAQYKRIKTFRKKIKALKAQVKYSKAKHEIVAMIGDNRIWRNMTLQAEGYLRDLDNMRVVDVAAQYKVLRVWKKCHRTILKHFEVRQPAIVVWSEVGEFFQQEFGKKEVTCINVDDEFDLSF